VDDAILRSDLAPLATMDDRGGHRGEDRRLGGGGAKGSASHGHDERRLLHRDADTDRGR